MPTVNRWRRMPTPASTVLENPAVMYQINQTNKYNQTLKQARENSYNTNGEPFSAWHTMMITTPWGNALTWIFMDDPDRNKRYFEFTDLKRWWWPIRVPYNEDNLRAFRELSNKEATWKYGRERFELLKPAPQIKLYEWGEEITLDKYIDNRKAELQKEFDKYVDVFKLYQKSSPETKEKLKPYMKQALDNYYNLKLNLYK